MKKFGGSWTEEKLTAFEKYVKAYLTILNKYKSKYNWQTIYFDGFAGFGERIDEISKQSTLFELNLSDQDKQEYSVYKGSVERVLGLPDPFKFDWYYFIETKQDYVNQLNQLIGKKYEHLKSKIVIRRKDCNEQLILLADLLKKKKNYRALVLLDPFGLQVNWKSIYDFKGTNSDIWILLPSGVGINRMLPKDGVIKYKNKLESFFGLPIEKIEEIFYFNLKQMSLFGKDSIKMKIPNSINKIVEIYIKQLQSVWKYVTKEPLVLLNSKNVPIFHFLFASNKSAGLKIASDIIKAK